MSPVATPRKPRVFARYPLDEAVEAHARRFFQLTTCDDPAINNWRQEAEAVMVRIQSVTEEDAKVVGQQLKFVCKHGVGTDQIAVKTLAAKGIVTMNMAGVNAKSVAELALGLTLALSRNITGIDRMLRDGQVVQQTIGATGFQLSGKTLGLIGGGNIALQVGRMFHGAFGSRIVIYDPYMSSEMLQRWQEVVPASRFSLVQTVKEVTTAVDILSVHVPLLDSTRGIIGEEELKNMRPNALVINTARGGVIDEAALLKALEQDWIAGAGIDAFSIEPPHLEHFTGLISHPRVISTPHIGAATSDIIQQTAFAVIDHLVDAFDGKLRDVVH